jgi:hypothetical protein
MKLLLKYLENDWENGISLNFKTYDNYLDFCKSEGLKSNILF